MSQGEADANDLIIEFEAPISGEGRREFKPSSSFRTLLQASIAWFGSGVLCIIISLFFAFLFWNAVAEL